MYQTGVPLYEDPRYEYFLLKGEITLCSTKTTVCSSRCEAARLRYHYTVDDVITFET